MNKIIKFTSIFIISILLLSSSVSLVKADVKSDDSSIVGDFANPVFGIDLTDGESIFNYDAELRESYNSNIAKGEEEKDLSLYDRFGGNLKFIPYYGEKKFKITIADKIYGNIKDNNKDFVIELDDIFEESRAKINNKVYDGRTDIVSEENYDAGFEDPRRSAYTGLPSSGGSGTLGNAYLTFSNLITETVIYLSGRGLFEDINTLWDYAIDSGVYEYIETMTKSLMPLVVAFFVFGLLRGIIGLVKGNESIGKILLKVLNFLVSIGIIYLMLVNPNVFRDLTSMAITKTDELFDKALVDEANEVASSDDDKYLLLATMWQKTVLDPWSQGMFDGRTYDEMYTQYSDKPDSKKLPQSNDNIREEWDEGKKYSSKTVTGDIKIPKGNDKFVRNWAALAWSTQSNYHINAVEASEESDDSDVNMNDTWPKAKVTPNNNDIYVDNFRWLDAKLNISPGYVSPEKHDNNYIKSDPYKESFIKYGFKSILMALLLLPMLNPIFRKLVVLVQIITIGVRWVYFSIMSIIKPYDQRYSQLSNIKNLFFPVYIYYWWSMVLYIMFFFYMALAGSMLGNVVWLILSYIIVKFKPIKSSRALREVTQNLKGIFTNRGRKR